MQKPKERAQGESIGARSAGSVKGQSKDRKAQKRVLNGDKGRNEHVNTPVDTNTCTHTPAHTHTSERMNIHSPTNTSARTRGVGSKHTGATQCPPDGAHSEAQLDVNNGASDTNDDLLQAHTHTCARTYTVKHTGTGTTSD